MIFNFNFLQNKCQKHIQFVSCEITIFLLFNFSSRVSVLEAFDPLLMDDSTYDYDDKGNLKPFMFEIFFVLADSSHLNFRPYREQFTAVSVIDLLCGLTTLESQLGHLFVDERNLNT